MTVMFFDKYIYIWLLYSRVLFGLINRQSFQSKESKASENHTNAFRQMIRKISRYKEKNSV